jgi:outer membrane protein OmpA-like peptidoglycan-associated protein
LDVIAASLKNLAQQKNMGYPINTNKDDFGLIVNESGKEGFVSSNRNRMGLDDDIYYFTRTKPVSFTNPIRVLVVDRATQKPIPMASVVPNNSLAPCTTDAEGFCTFDAEPNNTYSFVGKKEKYLDGNASIDLKEDQADALVRIYLDEFGNSLYCLVKERGTGLPLSKVNVTIIDKKTGEKFFEDATSIAGELRKRLANTKVNDVLSYNFRFEHPGYLTKTADFNYTIQKPGEIPVHELMDINLDKIEVGMDIGKIIHINPIYFDLNKFNIRPDASKELEKIVQVMKDNPTMVIELGSHTDCRSTAQYNMALSDKRAKASAQYVISKGIDQSRIYGKGFGEAKLVNGCACEGAVKPNCSEADHQLNRRTEFVIVKM